MYIVFEDGEFKTILAYRNEVVELLEKCERRTEPYDIYELKDVYPERYTDFVPDYYKNW